MKIPFDIKFRPQIESGEYKVETRDGMPVRVVCWDKKSNHPICGLAYEKEFGREFFVSARENGTTAIEETFELNTDLFLVTPEPEPSEFEKGYMRIVHKMKPKDFNDEGLKIAKEEAAKLLELARKELEPEVLERLDAAYKNQDEVVYENGKRDGKAEALKDLPRWDSNLKSSMVDEADVIGQWLYYKEHRIRISDLEKLPGFKED